MEMRRRPEYARAATKYAQPTLVEQIHRHRFLYVCLRNAFIWRLRKTVAFRHGKHNVLARDQRRRAAEFSSHERSRTGREGLFCMQRHGNRRLPRAWLQKRQSGLPGRLPEIVAGQLDAAERRWT